MAARRLSTVDAEVGLQQILGSASSGESGSEDGDVAELEDLIDTFSLNSSDSESDEDQTDEDQTPSRSPSQSVAQNLTWNWTQNELDPQSFPFVGTSGILVDLDETTSPLDIFQRFVTSETLGNIERETNLYATQHPEATSSRRHDTPFYATTAEELKVFLATSIMMGVVSLPEMQMYWSTNGMLDVPLFKKTMPRDRFIKIMRNLHFHNNDLDAGTDRLFKIRPLLDEFLHNFQEVYCPQKHISVDESMLKFHGRLKFKQYNPSKRARFGLKLYRLCESSGGMCGYTWNFKLYSGQDRDSAVPASTKVVMDLCHDLLGKGYYLYIDNWYSSPQLFCTLLQNKTHTVGTVRLNRKHMPTNLPGKKLKRGEHVFKTANGVMAMVWKDKKDVKMLSTWHSSELCPTGKTSINGDPIVKPTCVISYNQWMGGVDRSDQLSATCRSVRKHTKWYKKLFFYMVDIALVNSFLLFKKLHQEHRRLTLPNFKVMLAREMLESAEIAEYPRAGRKRSFPTPDRLRAKDGHFLEFNPPTQSNKNYKRCIVCAKNGQRREVRFRCDKCDVPLCPVPCFKNYHTKINY